MTIVGSEIALRENGRVERDWIALLEPAAALANQVAGTGFVPTGLRGNAAAIVAAILYGDELGLGPMQSLAKISVIEGKPTLSAEAQRALILAAGHEIRPTESTNTRVTMYGKRNDTGSEASVTWTLDDAKRANLAGKSNWRTYPRAMLTARASAELARVLFADVIGGLAATEEIEDVDPLALEPGTPEPAKKTTRRRRKAPALAAGVDPEDVTDSGPTEAGSTPDLPPLPDESAETLLEPAEAVPSDLPPGESRGDSPADIDPGEVARDEETTALSARSVDKADASPGQLKALNALVGSMRETEVELPDGTKSVVLSTAQIWAAAAKRRNVDADVMIELLEGRDADGVLHWSPLRDSLTKSEAEDLIQKLEDHGRKWGTS